MNIWQLDPANITPYYDKALCTVLADKGQNVHFFTAKYLYDETLTYPDTFSVDYHYFQHLNQPVLVNFPLLRRGLRVLSYPIDHWRLLQKCRQQKPNILHIQWSRVPVFDMWLIQQVQKMSIPVVHTVHDVVPLFSMGRFSGNLGDVLAQSDALIVHTAHSRDEVLKQYPQVQPHCIHIIPLIAEQVFIPTDATRQKARQQLAIADDIPMVLFFGNLRHYKGIDLLPQIFKVAKEKYADLQLWIVGRPETAADKLLVSELEQLQGVQIRAEFIPYDELWVYHLAADVAIYPYRNIFQSAALTAGLGFGCAVIVTDVGGLAEGVDGNGWVVPPENPQLFAEALIDALSDRERLQVMGQRSRQIVEERFSASQIAKKHVELYQVLLQQKSNLAYGNS